MPCLLSQRLLDSKWTASLQSGLAGENIVSPPNPAVSDAGLDTNAFWLYCDMSQWYFPSVVSAVCTAQYPHTVASVMPFFECSGNMATGRAVETVGEECWHESYYCIEPFSFSLFC